MKKIASLVISSLGALILASGCVGEYPTAEEDISSGDSALCENKDGVNAAMTALAVAAGREMRRVLPLRDFAWNYGTGRLETTSFGRTRCPNDVCTNVNAVLAMQDAPANTVKFPGNITLNPTAFRNALKKNYEEQVQCNGNGGCPVQNHDLQYTNWERGSCDVKYFFNVVKKDTTTRITDYNTLFAYENNLVAFGYPENKMLNFYIRNGQISVDPTSGLNEGGTTTSGSCSVACTRFSATNVAGSCCSCNGSNGTFQKSTFSPLMYLCK